MSYMIDRDEVIAAVERVTERHSSGRKPPTGVDHMLKFLQAEMIGEINKIDPQEIIGIDFTDGGRIPQEVVERCQFKEKEN